MGWNLRFKRKDDSGASEPPANESAAAGSESFVLTAGQRRHLEIAFRRLLVDAQNARARIRALTPDAGEPPAWLLEVRTELDRLTGDVQRAAEALDLSLDTRDVPLQRELAGWASTSWAMILDCRPSALRGYGSVDARLARALAPLVDGLAARLLHIERLAEDTPDPDPHDG